MFIHRKYFRGMLHYIYSLVLENQKLKYNGARGTQMEKVTRITDIIQTKDISSWTAERPVIISAGTGSGKSYFIKNTLYEYAKARGQKILMLIHRKACVDQFRQELVDAGKQDVVTVETYQKIEYRELKEENIDLEKYDYIVSDEFHYFISDASFNNTTDISLQKILDTKSAVKIFMSATGKYVERYLALYIKVEPIKYELKTEHSGLEQLYFYYGEEDLVEFAKELIDKNLKGIFFIQSVNQAYSLYKNVQAHALFCCSKQNTYYKYVDEKKIEKMLKEEKFHENILITTTCLDAGINLIDTELKHVFVDVNDIDSLVQCVGRKRIQNKEDTFVLYIRGKNNQQLGGKKSSLKKDIEMADFLKEHTVKELIEQYPRQYDKSKIIYDVKVEDKEICTKKINELMYLKKQFDLEEIGNIISIGKNGYCKYISGIFGKYDYIDVAGNYKICNYLENHVGQEMLTRPDRKELIDTLNIRNNGKLLTGRNIINGFFKDENLPFKIKEFMTNRQRDGKAKKYKHVWKIIKYDWETDTEI